MPMGHRLDVSDVMGMVNETGQDGGSVIAVEAEDWVKIDGVSEETVLSLLSESFPLRSASTLTDRKGELTNDSELFSCAGNVAFLAG